MKKFCAPLAVMLAASLVFTLPSVAEIKGKTAPQYELFEGVAAQFEGKADPLGHPVSGYEWKILSGSGGKLYDATSSKVTFVAEKISGEKEPFVIGLTTKYKSGKEGTARINVLVHKRPAKGKKTERVVERRYYGGPWPGFGLGYVWSRPLYVPVAVPCPDCDWDRDDFKYLDPADLPAEALPPDIPVADIPIDPPEIAEPVEPVPEIEPIEPVEPALEIEPVEPIEAEPMPMPMEEPIDMPMDEPMDMDMPDMDMPDFD